MAHLYRGEIHRMKLWRERLDRTSNWAVTLIAAILTYAFTGTSRSHYLILIGVVMVVVLLIIEARRYRGYDLWRSRAESSSETCLRIRLIHRKVSRILIGVRDSPVTIGYLGQKLPMKK